MIQRFSPGYRQLHQTWLLTALVAGCGGDDGVKDDPRPLSSLPAAELESSCARVMSSGRAYRTELPNPTCSIHGINTHEMSGVACNDARQECLEVSVSEDSVFPFACDASCLVTVAELEGCVAAYERETKRLRGYTCKRSRDDLWEASKAGRFYPEACDVLADTCPSE